MSYIISEKTKQLLGLESCQSWWQTQVFCCCCCWRQGLAIWPPGCHHNVCCHAWLWVLSFIQNLEFYHQFISFKWQAHFIDFWENVYQIPKVWRTILWCQRLLREKVSVQSSTQGPLVILGPHRVSHAGLLPVTQTIRKVHGDFTYPAHSTASPRALFKKLFCFGKTAQWYPFVLLMNLSRFLKINSDLTPKADLLPSSLDSSF